MKALVLGAGRIGRGFVTELLTKNNVPIVFFDNSKELVKSLNDLKKYTIHVLGHEDLNTHIENAEAYWVNDHENLVKKWEQADFIFTAVGGKNMASVGKVLAGAYKQIIRDNKVKKTNIITCENWVDPAKDLKEAILNELDESEKVSFNQNTGVSEAVVMATGTGAPNPSDLKNPMDTWVQNMWYLPVDKSRITGKLPAWECITFIDDFGDLLKQKLYTNNTSVALIAFLGRLRKFRYVSESANDPEIEKILDRAYGEINQSLINGMGINKESQLKFSKNAKAKYQDREIVDDITRIARDPIRKLGREDRLIGPAKIAMSIGIKPKAISMAIAAALYYENPQDESAVRLKDMREEKGIDYILQNISKLDENDPLISLVHESINDLKQMHWI